MTKGLVCVLLFATLFFLANSSRVYLDEDLQLQHNIDWYKSQTCGSPFLYDENFGGPGNVPDFFTNAAQDIADNLFNTGNDTTDLKALVTSQPCGFSRFISDIQLDYNRVNIHKSIIEITYTGPLVTLASTLMNNNAFNRIRRCPQFDNYAFGLRIDNSTNPETLFFVILAAASDPLSPCSGNTQLTTYSPYMCASPCDVVEATTGDVNYIPTPTRIAEGYIESDDSIILWHEFDGNTYADQTLDIYTLGQAGKVTFATPQNNDIVSVTPNDGDPNATVSAGTHINTWFMKFDPVGSTNPTSIQVSGSVVFSTPIIGAIFTQVKPAGSRTRLADTDATFGTLCVTYNSNINDPGIFRGLEYSTLLKTAEGFSIQQNVFTVNNFEAKQRGVDNVRIFTSCPYGPACDVTVNATTNVIIIPPPAFVTPGHLQDNNNVFLFRERRWLLSHPLTVDRVIPSYPDNYLIQYPSATDPQLGAGIAVTSWYFHAETIGTFHTNYTAAATFRDQIVAYIFRAINPPQNVGHETLKNTDALFGDHCTAYSPGFVPSSFRGLEFTTADSLNVDASGYRLDFILRVTSGQDDFRVLTQCDT